MEFFNSAIDILKVLVIALGAGLAVWGVINLLEGYGSDNPAAKSQGNQTAHGRRRCCPDWHTAYPPLIRPVLKRSHSKE